MTEILISLSSVTWNVLEIGTLVRWGILELSSLLGGLVSNLGLIGLSIHVNSSLFFLPHALVYPRRSTCRGGAPASTLLAIQRIR